MFGDILLFLTESFPKYSVIFLLLVLQDFFDLNRIFVFVFHWVNYLTENCSYSSLESKNHCCFESGRLSIFERKCSTVIRRERLWKEINWLLCRMLLGLKLSSQRYFHLVT